VGIHDETFFKALNLFLRSLFYVDKWAWEGGTQNVQIEFTVHHICTQFVHNYIEYIPQRGFPKLNLSLWMPTSDHTPLNENCAFILNTSFGREQLQQSQQTMDSAPLDRSLLPVQRYYRMFVLMYYRCPVSNILLISCMALGHHILYWHAKMLSSPAPYKKVQITIEKVHVTTNNNDYNYKKCSCSWKKVRITDILVSNSAWTRMFYGKKIKCRVILLH
jgi:hypothetical protein